MTSVLSRRTGSAQSARRRRLAALGTLGIVTALTGPALAMPAHAAPVAAVAAGPCSGRPTGYAARAGADLLKVGLLNLGPLGLNLPPVADVTLASSHSALSGASAVHSVGGARYADARVLGLKLPGGPLDGTVHQQAPPSHQNGVSQSAGALNLGVAKAGTGQLTAHAQWAEGMACGLQTGPAGEASAALLDAKVLSGTGGALAKAPNNATGKTMTGTLTRDGRAVAAAGAEIGLARLELLGGSIIVKVVEPPRLKVFASGKKETSAVEYDTPILEISGSGFATKRLSAQGTHLELAVPTTGGGLLNPLTRSAAEKRAKIEGLPLADGSPLSGLLDGLPISDLAGVTGRMRGDSCGCDHNVPTVPELDDLPVLGDVLDGLDPAGLPGSLGEIAVVRISLGDLEKQITDRGVTAQAASIRVELKALGVRGHEKATVLDLGIGLLNASATAPRWTGSSSSPQPSHGPSGGPSQQPSGTPSHTPGGSAGTTPVSDDKDCEGSGCSLPLTGTGIGVILGSGLLLFVGGRLLYVLSNRFRDGGTIA